MINDLICLIRSVNMDYFKHKYSMIKQRSRVILGVLLTVFLACNTANAFVDVTVLTGISCPGSYGSGITQHIAGAIGGYPDGPEGTHALDEYSVEIEAYHSKCTDSGLGWWNCSWNKVFEDFTYWEINPNSYITHYDSYFNVTGLVKTTTAGTWGIGWYWSHLEQQEYYSIWEYEQDYCSN